MSVTIEVPQTEITVSAGGEAIKVGCCISTGEGGESNTGLNVGGGDAGVFRDKSGWVLAFRTLVGGNNITITENADTIDVVATAAANDNELLFYSSGIYTGDSNLTWNGATGTLAIGSQLTIASNNVNNVNAIYFDTTPVDGPEVGKLIWDESEGTLALGMPGGNVNLQVGQEFLLLARNDTGATINNGDLVYISGGIGNRPTIALADNRLALLPAAWVLGMATEDIPHNSDGYVTSGGKVNELDTSACVPGEIRWLGQNGQCQATRPDAPDFSVGIGAVIRSHPSEGSVNMRPTIIPRLTSLSDVNIRETPIADENLIWWDGANARWDQVTPLTLSGSIDHGSTLGLLDNDHTQYTLRSDWLQNGFADRTQSTLAWTDTGPDRTLSIQPTGTNFVYFEDGVPYTSTGDTVQITDVEGLHYIYYDGATLTAVANPSQGTIDTVIRTKAIVAVVYWDSSAGTAIYVGEERHGAGMAPDTHAYLHYTEGLRWLSGLGLNSINADGAGATADAQFGVDAGEVTDEDLYQAISSIGSTTGLPIYYMLGASAEWQKHVEPGFSVRTFDGTSGTRLAWNQYTGGAWQLTEVANNRYVLCHVFATTEKDYPMVAIMGQDDYLSKNAAQAGATTEIQSLVLDDLLLPEIKPVATVIFQTSTSYASAVNARIISTEEGEDFVDWRSETVARGIVSTSYHGDLTGLLDDHHTQYALINGTRAFTGAVMIAGSADTEQFIIKANSTQSLSNPLIQLQDSAGLPLLDITTNDDTNVFMGVGAGVSVTTATGCIFIGPNAGASQQSVGTNIAIGQNALFFNVSGQKIVAIGQTAMQNYLGSSAIGIGFAAGKYQTGGACVYIGRDAGTGVSGTSTGANHTVVGYQSGVSLTAAEACTLYGYRAGNSIAGSAASYSVAVGEEAMEANTAGVGCVAVGRYAMKNATGGDHSVAVGYDCYGRALGGDFNTNVGNFAGRGVVANSYEHGTHVGYASGVALTTGSYNCLYGYRSGDNLSSGSYNIIIGHDLEASSATVNYELNIGDTITGDLSNGDVTIKRHLEIDGDLDHDGSNVGFYGTAPIAKPTVTGSKGGNAALASLLTQLAALGLITDSTT